MRWEPETIKVFAAKQASLTCATIYYDPQFLTLGRTGAVFFIVVKFLSFQILGSTVPETDFSPKETLNFRVKFSYSIFLSSFKNRSVVWSIGISKMKTFWWSMPTQTSPSSGQHQELPNLEAGGLVGFRKSFIIKKSHHPTPTIIAASQMMSARLSLLPCLTKNCQRHLQRWQQTFNSWWVAQQLLPFPVGINSLLQVYLPLND